MANGHSDTVRIALASRLTRRQVSADFGVGLSTLNKWVKAFDEDAIVSGPDQDLARQNERLRRENRILKEERDVFKAIAFFARQKT
jgi:transposase